MFTWVYIRQLVRERVANLNGSCRPPVKKTEQGVPLDKLCALVERHPPKPGKGRRPKEREQMLRIYFLQQGFNLAGPAVEEAL